MHIMRGRRITGEHPSRLRSVVASVAGVLVLTACGSAGDGSFPQQGPGGHDGGLASGAGGSPSPLGAGGIGGAPGSGGVGVGGVTGTGGGMLGAGGLAGTGGASAGGSRNSTGGAPGGGGAPGTGGTPSGTPPYSPVYRIPLRVHTGQSNLTNAELGPILAELNSIWLSQAGICFEVEVTKDETNQTVGFDFRYVSGPIPDAPTANGLTEGPHAIWSIDHPNLGTAPNPVQNPAARTTAHELGHALGLDHENQPPSTDCATPCYCVTLNLNCDDFLMRSGRKGFFLSEPEIQISRTRAAQRALADTTPTVCGAPVFKP